MAVDLEAVGCQRLDFVRAPKDLEGLIAGVAKVATYLDQQARLFFWYRNRARKDYYVQGWKPRRIYADFIVTLKDEEREAANGFDRVFVVETKGVHLKQSEDTDYKRSVFDICGEHARKAERRTGPSSRPRCGPR